MNETELKATEDCYASKMLEESNAGGAQAGSTESLFIGHGILHFLG